MADVPPRKFNSSSKPKSKLPIVWIFVVIILVVIGLIILFIWLQRRHTQQCQTNKDCANGESCQQNQCVPSSNNSCSPISPCPTGEICVSGICQKPPTNNCTQDSQCPTGQTCDLTTNQCVPHSGGGVGSTCSLTIDCNTGLYCSGALTCQLNSNYQGGKCSNDTQCQVGNHCDLATQSCISNTGGNPGQSCSAQQPCRSDSFCSSVDICHQGIPLQPGETCSQVSQCGMVDDVSYYCNFTKTSPTCDTRQLSASTISLIGFNPIYLTLAQDTDSVLSTLYGKSSFNLVSGNTQIIIPGYTKTGFNIPISASPTTGIVGLQGPPTYFNVDPTGILVTNSQPSSVRLYQYSTNFMNETVQYIIVDQYGNPLIYSPNTTLPNYQGVLGFYDPINYPAQVISPAFGFVPTLLGVD